MDAKELDNLNRDELFKELKGNCKSIVKRDLYINIFVCILGIPLLFFTAQRLILDETVSIAYYIFWIVIVCLGCGLLLFDFQSLKKVDKLDTPDRLLYWFEKKFRPDLRYIFWLVLCLFIARRSSPSSHVSVFENYLVVVIGFVIMALIFYRGAPWVNRKEKVIIERLRELVKKK